MKIGNVKREGAMKLHLPSEDEMDEWPFWRQLLTLIWFPILASAAIMVAALLACAVLFAVYFLLATLF